MKNMNANKIKALLALADGTIFEGQSFGAEGETIGEVVFNTSITGYQETGYQELRASGRCSSLIFR